MKKTTTLIQGYSLTANNNITSATLDRAVRRSPKCVRKKTGKVYSEKIEKKLVSTIAMNYSKLVSFQFRLILVSCPERSRFKKPQMILINYIMISYKKGKTKCLLGI